ncbi:SCO2322 family protein [Streptomyces sp. NBRC 110611]|uniref:SCO2322 family protein n=1 Tax=Streptomyces sp. NBRC 110611 TaxID=1621259 RepID=UPI00215CFCAF|nr:SCO2322 family protein [Streptomyces sp. NBRC 110611]
MTRLARPMWRTRRTQRHQRTRRTRRTRLTPLGRGFGTLLLAGAAVGLGAGPAQAQEYRYWSFWQGADAKGGSGPSGSGSWTYATAGPGTVRPADGTVEGFRFTVSADSAAAGTPRTAADFDAICRDTPAKDGRKRIGVVIDFGTATDAPDGERPPKTRTECAQVPEDASAGEALAAVAPPLRYDSSALLCAIAGFPKAGCGDQVNGSGGAKGSGSKGAEGAEEAEGTEGADASGSKASGDGTGGAGSGTDDGPSAGLLGGVAAVVVLGAAAGWQARRRRG